MAGHSKWANIKYRKAQQDQRRGRLFSKLVREIMVAARQGPDPEKNVALAQAIERARAHNLPKETIERAIQRAAGGGGEGERLEEVVYEGFGPGGVAVLVRALTDNKNRTAAALRRLFEDHGGHFGGAVAWLFERRGIVTLDRTKVQDLDELFMQAIDLGAEDIAEEDSEIKVYCDPANLRQVREGLERLGVPVERAEATLVPKTTVRLEGREAERTLRFLNALDDHDDVQEVYANFDIPEALLQQAA